MESITSILQKLCFSTFMFKIKLTDRNLEEVCNDDTVIRVFNLNQNMEEKNRGNIKQKKEINSSKRYPSPKITKKRNKL